MALTKCPECNKIISKSAKNCPHCGYRFKKMGSISWMGIIILALIIVYIIINTNGTKSNRDYTSERMAYNLCKDYVLQNLKSPKTAEFPGIYKSKNHVEYKGNGQYEIRSWVDSENSFGALIRTKFHCVMIKNDKDKWELEKLKFLE